MDQLTTLANSHRPLPSRFTKKDDGFTRSQVVDAFQRAFDMIGGVERLTLWAHENPGDFFRLYAKLLPATTVSFGSTGTLIIEHTIAKGALDQHEQIDNICQNLPPQDVAFIMSNQSCP